MRNLDDLISSLEKTQQNVVIDLVKVQKETANSICHDTKEFAPVDKGNYRDSIHVKGTLISKDNISTEIVTDAVVQAKSNGNVYNLGYLLENGTLEHAIPNAFGLGYFYGYVDRFGYRHKGTLDKDWHPGFRPLPHFIPALLLNKENYHNAIFKAINKEFK